MVGATLSIRYKATQVPVVRTREFYRTELTISCVLRRDASQQQEYQQVNIVGVFHMSQ